MGRIGETCFLETSKRLPCTLYCSYRPPWVGTPLLLWSATNLELHSIYPTPKSLKREMTSRFFLFFSVGDFGGGEIGREREKLNWRRRLKNEKFLEDVGEGGGRNKRKRNKK